MADSIQSQSVPKRKPSTTPEYQRIWNEKNPEKSAEYQRKYRQKNLEKCREREQRWRDKNPEYPRRKRLRSLYGITIAQYDAVLEKQNGVCAICCEPSRDGRRLAVDHCHYTNKIRGLLCFHCNTAIGKLGDSADKVARAVKYLQDGGT